MLRPAADIARANAQRDMPPAAVLDLPAMGMFNASVPGGWFGGSEIPEPHRRMRQDDAHPCRLTERAVADRHGQLREAYA